MVVTLFQISALIGLASAGVFSAGATDMDSKTPKHSSLRPEGNPDLAVLAELDQARRAGTIAAYRFFLARQGNHRLAGQARRELAILERKGGKASRPD